MKNRNSIRIATLSLAMLAFGTMHAQIYTPSGDVENNTGGNDIGIGTGTPAARLEVQAGSASNTTLLLQNLQNLSPGDPPNIGEPTYAFEVKQQTPGSGDPLYFPPSTNFTTFSIRPNGRTKIGTFPTDAPETLALSGNFGMYLSGSESIKLRWGSPSTPELIWNTSTSRNFRFKNGNNNLTVMSMSPSGKLGVGTENFTTDHNLRVQGQSLLDHLRVQEVGDWNTDDNYVALVPGEAPALQWEAESDIFSFRSGSSTPLRLHSSGKVGVNTDHFVGDHSLYIEGSVIMEEAFVKLKENWFPDYVFAPDYELMTLTEVEDYIKCNGRLPGMPSAEQVCEEGLALGETQRLLTEKVEELTLYLLTMNKEMEALREEITTLRGEK